MNLLFVHDHPFYKEDDLVYTGGSFPYSLWDNYLINFNNIFIYARRSYNIDSKGVITSGRNNVKFILTEKYSSIRTLFFNYKSIKNELFELFEDVDVVLIRLPSILGLIAGHLALKKGKKIWIEQVGNGKESFLNHGSVIGKVGAYYINYMNKKLVSKADFVSYVTKNKLQKDYPPSSSAVSISLSDVLIYKVLKENDLNLERFYGNKLKISLLGGFDTNYKGQELLLKAVSLLDLNCRDNIELYFAGKGNGKWIYKKALDLGVESNVKFVGSLAEREEVNRLLLETSLYVQPSLTEGMPRSIIEAMAMGCPVLGSNVGGIPDLVPTKFLHKKGDYKHLAKQIFELYQKRNLLERESKLNLIKAENFLKASLDQQRVKFYREMNILLNEKDN